MDPKISQCSVANVNDTTAPPKSFTFDGVYYTDSTTEAIYNEIAYPLVEGVLEGLHTLSISRRTVFIFFLWEICYPSTRLVGGARTLPIFGIAKTITFY